jgi:phage/plasmid-associated DNA primase
VMQFVKQVLPNVDEREYVLALLASFCDGQIQEKFHIFVGSGGNGKSKLIELFQKAMGDKYCGQLPVTALTGKQASSNAATPEFARLKGMRFVVMQEPDQKERLHAGKLKELTGGDVLHARALHKEPIEFKPQFGLVMASNVLPEVPGDDGGVWRRMRVVRFNSKFVEEAKANPAEHMYPIDEQLVKKLDEWRFAFFWVLMQYYKVFTLGDEDKTILQYDDEMNQAFPTNGPQPGLRKSMSIASETQKYKQRNNYIGDFIDTVVSKNHPESVVITLHELWMRYSNQCRADGRLPNKEELRDAMELRFNEMQTVQDKHKGWKGVRLEVEGGAVGA